VRAARRFLEEGHKVKVEVRFRGREATHPEVARDQINRIAQGVSDIAIVERAPSLEGRSMFAILARGRAKGSEGGGPTVAAAPAAAAQVKEPSPTG
jgi:translation initiation factor IF-3